RSPLPADLLTTHHPPTHHSLPPQLAKQLSIFHPPRSRDPRRGPPRLLLIDQNDVTVVPNARDSGRVSGHGHRHVVRQQRIIRRTKIGHHGNVDSGLNFAPLVCSST